MARIVETDNYGRDYPDESFLNLPRMDKETMSNICELINNCHYSGNNRYWKVVENDYKLQPGFEP